MIVVTHYVPTGPTTVARMDKRKWAADTIRFPDEDIIVDMNSPKEKKGKAAKGVQKRDKKAGEVMVDGKVEEGKKAVGTFFLLHSLFSLVHSVFPLLNSVFFPGGGKKGCGGGGRCCEPQ